jgi:hypothetical protein
VLQAKENAPTLSPSILFTFGFVVESIKEFRGAFTISFYIFFKENGKN